MLDKKKTTNNRNDGKITKKASNFSFAKKFVFFYKTVS